MTVRELLDSAGSLYWSVYDWFHEMATKLVAGNVLDLTLGQFALVATVGLSMLVALFEEISKKKDTAE